MEALLHYCWKHKLLPLAPLETTDHRMVEVIDPGLHNRHAGPDFFNAKVKVGGTLWVGNVEIHDKASDWYRHCHNNDAAYDNVILHVCGEVDDVVLTSNGREVPQVSLKVPQYITDHYHELITTDHYPPCYSIIPQLSGLMLHSWMSALQTERLEQKTQAIRRRCDLCEGDWEAAYFVTLARNYGFGVNGDAFEAWANSIPLHAVDHHRDNLFQVEAIFLGQAGLLDVESVPQRYQQIAIEDEYFNKMLNEYAYLKHKFQLTPINHKLWKFLRMRPQNFPHIRISQLAHLYHSRQASLSQLVECSNMKEVRRVLATNVSPYWESHYVFGVESPKRGKSLSAHSLQVLAINTAIPMLFAYGRYRGDERLCDRAFSLLEELKAEDNNIVRMWRDCGLVIDNAGDSQALIQLKKEYCDKKDCLHCRIGYEYMRKK